MIYIDIVMRLLFPPPQQTPYIGMRPPFFWTNEIGMRPSNTKCTVYCNGFFRSGHPYYVFLKFYSYIYAN